jgi:UDP-N-acetylglucosamine 1-carboxyvinyltransferase
MRRIRGLTQTQMAARLGISQATLNRLENGSQNITLRTLVLLARAMRCDVVDLLSPLKARRRDTKA